MEMAAWRKIWVETVDWREIWVEEILVEMADWGEISRRLLWLLWLHIYLFVPLIFWTGDRFGEK